MAPALDAPIMNLELLAGLPAREHTRRRRRNPTVTITPSAPNETSTTDAPGRRSIRENAVWTRTLSSSAGR